MNRGGSSHVDKQEPRTYRTGRRCIPFLEA